MERTFAAAERVITAAGDLWLYALALVFIAIAVESAKPKPAEDAEPEKKGEGPSFLLVLLGLVNMVTPFMLFWHGFQAARDETSRPLYIVGLLVGGAVVLGALLGWTIGAASPGFGRFVTRAAPVLNIAAFALALYVAQAALLELAG